MAGFPGWKFQGNYEKQTNTRSRFLILGERVPQPGSEENMKFIIIQNLNQTPHHACNAGSRWRSWGATGVPLQGLEGLLPHPARPFIFNCTLSHPPQSVHANFCIRAATPLAGQQLRRNRTTLALKKQQHYLQRRARNPPFCSFHERSPPA